MSFSKSFTDCHYYLGNVIVVQAVSHFTSPRHLIYTSSFLTINAFVSLRHWKKTLSSKTLDPSPGSISVCADYADLHT